MRIMQVIYRMIQDIALGFDELDILPQRLDGQHVRLAERIHLPPAHERELFELEVGFVVGRRLTVGAEGDDGEVGAVAEAPALLFGVGVARFEDLLCEALERVLVQVVPFVFELVAAADEGTPGRGPGVGVERDEVAEFFQASLGTYLPRQRT